MNNIAVLGPNPAWQKTLFFDRFAYGKINRAKEMQQFPAGKGINFCRAAACHSRAVGRLVQFTGGENGGEETSSRPLRETRTTDRLSEQWVRAKRRENETTR